MTFIAIGFQVILMCNIHGITVPVDTAKECQMKQHTYNTGSVKIIKTITNNIESTDVIY